MIGVAVGGTAEDGVTGAAVDRAAVDGGQRSAPAISVGFTLVELLVVMTIVGLLAALALPRFEAVLPGGEPAEPAARVAEALKRARTEAARGGRTVCVEADSSTGALRLLWRMTAGDSVEVVGDAGAPVAGAAPGSAVCFSAAGLATPARLSVGGSSAKVVEVDPWDGEITIRD